MVSSTYGGYKSSTIPNHTPPNLDWQQNTNRKAAVHNGAADSFNYVFPVNKYVEAYSMGPVWNDSGAYMIGNQPYNYKDGLNIAYHTPAVPNHLTLVNSAPRYSSASVQNAQITMGRLLASRSPGVGL